MGRRWHILLFSRAGRRQSSLPARPRYQFTFATAWRELLFEAARMGRLIAWKRVLISRLAAMSLGDGAMTAFRHASTTKVATFSGFEPGCYYCRVFTDFAHYFRWRLFGADLAPHSMMLLAISNYRHRLPRARFRQKAARQYTYTALLFSADYLMTRQRFLRRESLFLAEWALSGGSTITGLNLKLSHESIWLGACTCLYQLVFKKIHQEDFYLVGQTWVR